MQHTKQGTFPFVVKIVILLCVFGLFPAFVAVVALNYKHQAETVLEAGNPQADSNNLDQSYSAFETGDAKVLTEDQANTLQKVRSLIVGRWVSLQDKQYVVEILPNNTFTDSQGSTVVAYGTWGSFVSATSSSNIQLDASSSQDEGGINNIDASYYLAKVHYEDKYKNQKFIYEIMQLDQDRAILYYTGNSKILYFVREALVEKAGGTSALRR